MRTNGRLLGSLAIALQIATGAHAQFVVYSPDVTAEIGPGGASSLTTDEDAALDDGSGASPYLLFPLGLIPASADVIAVDPLEHGLAFVSFDTTIALPGIPPGTVVEPRDVVRFDNGTSFTMVLDGSDPTIGIPASARIDAVSHDAATPDPDLLLSFDTTVALPGGVIADDEDVVRYSGGSFFPFFDGSSVGVASEADVDGAHLETSGDGLLISFDTTGSVAGVIYDDEDIVRYDLNAGVFTLFLDASTIDPAAWPSADMVALPEPGGLQGAVLGAAALAVLGRRRTKRGVAKP